MLDQLDRYEKDEWERDCFGPALICAVLANINRDPKKKPHPFTVADFMPNLYSKSELKKKQTPEQMLNIVKLINAAYDGDVI